MKKDVYDSEYIDGYLSNEDLTLIPHDIEEVWYWYAVGYYCGVGHIIARCQDDLWYHHDCSHCSCYGPTESINFNSGYVSLDAMFSNMSESLKQELEPITVELKKSGLI